MQLYLSSYKLGSEPQKLKELVDVEKKVAVIANALDFSDEFERKQHSIQRELDDLAALGLQAEEMDLRDYFERRDELVKKLGEFGLIWAIGGNSFVLRRAMRQSGFDELVKQYHSEHRQSFVYAGYSAGAVVAAPTLRGIELVDDPKVVPATYESEIIWEGLGLINFSIAPHYRSNHPEAEAIEHVVRYFQQNNIYFRALSDGEVIITQ